MIQHNNSNVVMRITKPPTQIIPTSTKKLESIQPEKICCKNFLLMAVLIVLIVLAISYFLKKTFRTLDII